MPRRSLPHSMPTSTARGSYWRSISAKPSSGTARHRTGRGQRDSRPDALKGCHPGPAPPGGLANRLARLSGFAFRGPPMPDQCLTVGGMLGRPVLFRNSPFQFFDGRRSVKRLFLVAEAKHLDAAVVRHHFLETQMGERSEVQQFVHRQRDNYLVFSGRHLQPAGVVSPAPAGGADGIAKDPKPGLVSIDAFLVGCPARERPHRLDGLCNIIGGGLPRRLIMRTDAADDFERRLFHACEPPLGEIRFCGRPGRGQQEDKQHNYDGQDAHHGTSSEAKPTPGQNIKRKSRASPISRPLLISARRVPQFGNNDGLELPARIFVPPYNCGRTIGRRKKHRQTPQAISAASRRWLYGVVIQARASRWAMAISTSDISSATSRRSRMASARPFRAARLNHLCAATRLTTPERPLAQYRPRSNSTSGIALACTGVAASRSMCP